MIEQVIQQIPHEHSKQVALLSDFDYTLCHRYVEDENDNLAPSIDSEVARQAQRTDLYIATGRRAESVALASIWNSGLYPKDRPLIAENGGVLVYNSATGRKFLDLIYPWQTKKLPGIKQLMTEALEDLDDDYIIKTGRTMIVARLKKEAEEAINPEKHQQLLETVEDTLSTQHEFRAIDNRTSVTVQHRTVSKRVGFAELLKKRRIDRKGMFLVGLGDGLNDTEIFSAADLSIGFNPIVGEMVDTLVEPSDQMTAAILRAIADVSNQEAS